MAPDCDFENEVNLDLKLMDLWPKHPSIYNVQSQDFKDRGKREQAIKISLKLGQNDNEDKYLGQMGTLF